MTTKKEDVFWFSGILFAFGMGVIFASMRGGDDFHFVMGIVQMGICSLSLGLRITRRLHE